MQLIKSCLTQVRAFTSAITLCFKGKISEINSVEFGHQSYWIDAIKDGTIDSITSDHHPIEMDKKNTPPYSMDANLLHISYEGKVLEDPWCSPPEDM